MIISGGENIYSAEVESALYAHPAIAEVAVIGIPDDKWGETVLAIAVLKTGQTLSLESLRDFAALSLARFKLPRALEIVGQICRDLGARDVKGDDNIAKVSIVGVGMRSHAGIASQTFEALAAENINIRMISTSEIKISVVIEAKYVELAVRSLHRAFKLDEQPPAG